MDRLTNTWADILITQLVSSGIRQYFIAPGSRTTPLIAAIKQHPLAETYIHYDERGLGFYALGHAKVDNTPTALVVTSGSALAHLFPAVMEAYYARIPLLLLTADRPYELLDCGENQTADQTHFFGRYVHGYYPLVPKDEYISPNYVSSLAVHAAKKMLSPEIGPVHINCIFREPFFTDKQQDEHFPTKTHYAGISVLSEKEIEAIALRLSQYKKGVVLAATYRDSRLNEYISILARKLHWPVISCITSPYRTGKGGKYHIHYSDMLAHSYPIDSVECVFQIGDRFVSKTLFNKLHKASIKDWIILSETLQRRDQGLTTTMQISAEPNDTLFRLTKTLYTHEENGWPYLWTKYNKSTLEKLHKHFESSPIFSEYHIFHTLSLKQEYGGSFFFGNSLSIRNADAFFYPHYETKVYTSRGVSGIDGHIGTAAGIALAEKGPIIAVIGDQTFLHDLNSLPLLTQCKHPILLLIVNNGGGKIFSFLPIKEHKELHTSFFYNPHSYNLSQAGTIFGIKSIQIASYEEFKHALDSFLIYPKTTVVELLINTRCITEEKKHLLQLLSVKNNELLHTYCK